jgi:hypothetical protein
MGDDVSFAFDRRGSTPPGAMMPLRLSQPTRRTADGISIFLHVGTGRDSGVLAS